MAQKTEIALREKAVTLFSQGVNPTEISRLLNRSRQWVYKWINRYIPDTPGWSCSLSNAPVSPSCKTSESVEQAIVETRLKLEKTPYMESGAYAIYHDLLNRGFPCPSVATINRILKKNGLVKKRVPYHKSGIEYPANPINMHLMDLVGPCHIRGGQRYYLLDIISNDTRHGGVYPILSKSAKDVTESVVSFWQDYSLPDFLQMDNELSFKGSNRHPRSLGLLLRTLLELGVTPVFIPTGEPWRNGVIERFNQKVEKTFLMEHHNDFEEVLRCAKDFNRVHNTQHHYSTLGNKTPEQLEIDLAIDPSPLSKSYMVDKKPIIDS